MARIFSLSIRQKVYSDFEMVEGLKTNQREVVEYIYHDFFSKARGLLQKMGAKEEEVEDIFQEGMVALWKNIQQQTYELNSNVKLSSYFLEICKRRWWEKIRNQKKQINISIDEVEVSNTDPNVLDQWLKQEEQDQFQRLYRTLGERCQDILRRFYYEKESMKQIALAFSLTEPSARNEKYRCMQRLKTIFQSQNQ